MEHELLKNRSISEVAVDTIRFVRDHFKIVLKPLLVYALPLLVLVNLLPYLMMDSFMSGNVMDMMGVSLLIVIGALVVVYLVYFIGVSAVHQVYHQKQDTDPTAYFKDCLNRYGGSFIVVLILYTIAITLGFIVFVLPGIYLTIAFYTAGVVLFFEQETSTDALGRAMKLSKGFWWYSFLAVVLLALFVYIVSAVLALPAIFLAFLAGMSGHEAYLLNPGEEGAMFWVMAALNVISETLGGLVQVISGIGAAMLYFSLKEKQEGSSIQDQLDELESDLDDTDDFETRSNP